MYNNLKRQWYAQFSFHPVFEEENNIKVDINKVINETLFHHGAVVAYKDPLYGVVFGKFITKYRNIYEEPKVIEITIGASYRKTVDIDECIVLYNDSSRLIPVNEVIKYGKKLELLDKAIKRNLNKLMSANILIAKRNTAKALKQSVMNARDADFVITEKELATVGQINLGEAYLIDKYQLQKEIVYNEFLTNMGVDNINRKRERMNNDEVNANNNRIDIVFRDMFNQRYNFVNELKEKFDYDLELIVNNDYSDSEEKVENEIREPETLDFSDLLIKEGE